MLRRIWPFLFFFIVTPVSAMTLEFKNTPSLISKDQEFSIDVFLSCSACSDSYLRGVFYLSGTNYFGYTQNNTGAWVNASGTQASQYFQITKDDLKEGSWSGKLVLKPDVESKLYSGPGSYFFKIGRYTASGSVTWATPVSINITGPTPTPPPTPTTKVISTPSPVPTEFVPTLTPKPMPTKTISPTAAFSLQDSSGAVLASTSEPLASDEATISHSTPWISYLVIGIGCVLIVGAIIFKL